MTAKTGIVYLIGAGPGDPGLLTIKAKECIEAADVVVYDYLASPYLLEYAKEDAQIIYVGKKGGDHTLSQDGINQLLVDKAKEGLDVARLKGGDPFVFGRGGEEAQMLLSYGVSYEVIPGVTSAVAAPAYAGIPITHRAHTSFVSFITGHENPNKKDSSMQWDVFAKSNATLVFFMGVKNLANIVEQLIKHGKDKDTPRALTSLPMSNKLSKKNFTPFTLVKTSHSYCLIFSMDAFKGVRSLGASMRMVGISMHWAPSLVMVETMPEACALALVITIFFPNNGRLSNHASSSRSDTT